MKSKTIQCFQWAATFGPSTECLFLTGWTVEQLAQYLQMRHIWATDNLYRLPHSEGATVIIQSNAN